MTSIYLLRPMHIDDIPQVVQIDRASFPTPWSARTYQFELTNRSTSHLVVLEIKERSDNSNSGGLRALWRRLRGVRPNAGPVIGYGGCWIIAGEAHISTIAVHPAYRGRGLGELLLASMLLRAINLQGEYSVLEVRASNASAQALYRKYEYQMTGRRKGYYRDNGEDALRMEARPLDAAYHQRLKTRLDALRHKIDFVDEFSQ